MLTSTSIMSVCSPSSLSCTTGCTRSKSSVPVQYSPCRSNTANCTPTHNTLAWNRRPLLLHLVCPQLALPRVVELVQSLEHGPHSVRLGHRFKLQLERRRWMFKGWRLRHCFHALRPRHTLRSQRQHIRHRPARRYHHVAALEWCHLASGSELLASVEDLFELESRRDCSVVTVSMLTPAHL